MKLVPATKADIPELLVLLQEGYRGEKGWCHDSHLIEGPRATREMVEKDMSSPSGLLWKCVADGKEEDGGCSSVIMGCVYSVLKFEINSMYIGSLCVNPNYQARGIGKMLVKAVEERAQSLQCSSVYLQTISARTDLVEWYERQGYILLKEKTVPFPEGMYGKFKVPSETMKLVTLNKNLN